MSYPEVTALEAFEALDGYRVIDVREDHEFHGPLGRIESAELVPLASVEANAEKLGSGRPLLLVCRSGKRSGMACEKLSALGCDDLTNLSGGMIGWNQANLAVLHSEPTSLTALVDQIVTWTAQVGPLTRDAALEMVRERLEQQSASCENPSHRAVEEFIGFVGDSLAAIDPPDLELCLAFFRRSLAVL